MLGHDKISLCLAATHVSTFNTLVALFLIKSERETFFVLFVNFYQQTFLVTFYLILAHLPIHILTKLRKSQFNTITIYLQVQ